ncbi:MAG: alpha/beta hydrolase [Clostridiales bacterium]|jgi:acetyl esterase/lipase|nr:alpha/beta hydrolase [Clostridiales bacterium]
MEYNCYDISAGGYTAQLFTYLLSSSPEIGIEKRPLVIICPGGGYILTSDRESEPVAMRFLAMGMHAFVLRYSVEPARFPVALSQLAKSVALARENAELWHIDPDKIVVMGFSAGGHLAASLGVFWGESFLHSVTGLSAGQIKPNGMALCYPVLTASEYCHAGSFEALLGEASGDPEKRDRVSVEKQANPQTPPAFIWHTYEDLSVPVENSLLMMDALRKNNIPFEAHIYPKGRHGLSLATALTEKAEEPGSMTGNPEVSGWAEMCARWIFDL